MNAMIWLRRLVGSHRLASALVGGAVVIGGAGTGVVVMYNSPSEQPATTTINEEVEADGSDPVADDAVAASEPEDNSQSPAAYRSTAGQNNATSTPSVAESPAVSPQPVEPTQPERPTFTFNNGSQLSWRMIGMIADLGFYVPDQWGAVDVNPIRAIYCAGNMFCYGDGSPIVFSTQAYSDCAIGDAIYRDEAQPSGIDSKQVGDFYYWTAPSQMMNCEIDNYDYYAAMVNATINYGSNPFLTGP
jgi:hypothetical protein